MGTGQAERPPDGSTQGPDIGSYLDDLSGDAKAWYEAQKAYTKLEVSGRIGNLSSMLIYGMIIGLLTATVLVMWFVALAIWIGHMLGHMALGFLVSGGIFLVCAGLFYLMWHNGLKDKVTVAVINAMYHAD